MPEVTPGHMSAVMLLSQLHHNVQCAATKWSVQDHASVHTNQAE